MELQSRDQFYPTFINTAVIKKLENFWMEILRTCQRSLYNLNSLPSYCGWNESPKICLSETKQLLKFFVTINTRQNTGIMCLYQKNKFDWVLVLEDNNTGINLYNHIQGWGTSIRYYSCTHKTKTLFLVVGCISALESI